MAQKPVRKRRDRWADWAVIGTLVVALLLGWAVAAFAQGQTAVYRDLDAGLSVRYPKGWYQKADDRLAFQAVNPDSGRFKTTYQVRIWPIPVDGDPQTVLGSVLNGASLARAQEGVAFRLFDIEPGAEIDDQPSMEATYVYVAESMDLFSQRLPAVVQGLDIAIARGDQAYVFSLLAHEDAYEDALRDFRAFVKSAEVD